MHMQFIVERMQKFIFWRLRWFYVLHVSFNKSLKFNGPL